MIRLVFTLLLWASAAMANEVVIQAGEHDGFTRLSLHVGAADWHFGRTAQGYGLRVGTDPDFRIEQVFNTIRRDRITALNPVASGLDLAVACECHARVFPYGDGWVVVDIIDGPPAEDAANESPLTPIPRRPDRGALPLLFPPTPIAAMFLPDTTAPRIDSPISTPTERATQIGQTVADGLLRAADLGLLDLATPAALSAASGADPDDDSGSGTSPGVIAGTGMDNAVTAPGQPRAAGCLDDRLFDLAAWAGPEDFTTGLATRRAQLSDGHGMNRLDSVEHLARFYLAHGFGREAVEALSLAPNDSLAHDIMHLLAEIVDDRPVPPATFADQAACRGHSLFWHVLAQESVADLDEAGRSRVITSLRLLPESLSDQLAPRLALLFAQAGDALAADEILHRARGGDAVTATHAGVEIARASGDEAATAERLAAAVHDDPRSGPQALLDMIELTLASHRAAEPGDLALLAAAQFEYRDQPEALELATARIRLLSHIGEHHAALMLANELPRNTGTTIRAETFMRLVDDADDGLFLEIAFDTQAEPPDPGSAHAVAARLITLGFPERALALMQHVDPGTELAERRYLRAEAAALMGRGDLVEAELLGLTDPRAAMIRNSIIPVSDQEPLISEPDAPAADDPGPLARSTALIEGAEATRHDARELLELIAADLSP